ncbi:ATP-dependent Clp protease proteolytic subunit 2 [Lactobacillus delbrueckii subsp. lactis DSM 20072]|nr:ATP-dependent Clp protease proteolytic subunit 2 [Lactobacillus delbrueckii subsp. lactis DSM 20072]
MTLYPYHLKQTLEVVDRDFQGIFYFVEESCQQCGKMDKVVF